MWKKKRGGGGGEIKLVEGEGGRRERPGSTERGNKVRRRQPPAGLVFTARPPVYGGSHAVSTPGVLHTHARTHRRAASSCHRAALHGAEPATTECCVVAPIGGGLLMERFLPEGGVQGRGWRGALYLTARLIFY